MKALAASPLALFISAQTLFAAPPQFDAIQPPGGQVGSSIDLTMQGKFDPWPCQLEFSAKGFSFTPDPEKAGTGKLQIPEDAPLGPIEVRVRNPEGISKPQFFVIGKIKEIAEIEADKNAASAGQVIKFKSLPLTVNGTLSGNHELDAFQIALKKSQTIHAAVDGYRIRSLIDPVLHVYDSEGNRLVLAHDTPSHLDPRLSFTAPVDGNYTFAVTAFAHPPAASVYYRGDKKAVYRLYLGADQEQLPAHLYAVPLGDDSKVETITPGKAVVGTLPETGKPATWKVTAKKGEKWFVEAEAASLGFETDPVLRILKPDGSELRSVDDSNKTPDAQYLWSVSADGDYQISIADRFHRGGSPFRYRLSLEKGVPDLSAISDQSEYLLEPGKSIDIKLKITRTNGHTAEVTCLLPDLPPGVEWKDPKPAPAKNGDWVIKLEAKADAKPFQKPFRIQLKEKAAEGEKAPPLRLAQFSYTDDNSRGPYLLEEASQIWLTIPHVKKEEKKTEEKKK